MVLAGVRVVVRCPANPDSLIPYQMLTSVGVGTYIFRSQIPALAPPPMPTTYLFLRFGMKRDDSTRALNCKQRWGRSDLKEGGVYRSSHAEVPGTRSLL